MNKKNIAIKLFLASFALVSNAYSADKLPKAVCRGNGPWYIQLIEESAAKALQPFVLAGMKVSVEAEMPNAEPAQQIDLIEHIGKTYFDTAIKVSNTGGSTTDSATAPGLGQLKIASFDASKIPSLFECSIKKDLLIKAEILFKGKKFKLPVFKMANVIIPGFFASPDEYKGLDKKGKKD